VLKCAAYKSEALCTIDGYKELLVIVGDFEFTSIIFIKLDKYI